VVGVGPQIGFVIPISSTTQGYLNFKGYKEFDNANRAEGWTEVARFGAMLTEMRELRERGS
jgi:hypothetical protein